MKNERVSTAMSVQNDSYSVTMKNNSDLFRSKTANVIHNKRPSKKDTEQIIGRMSKASSIKTYISLKQQGKLHKENPWGLRGKKLFLRLYLCVSIWMSQKFFNILVTQGSI